MPCVARLRVPAVEVRVVVVEVHGDFFAQGANPKRKRRAGIGLRRDGDNKEGITVLPCLLDRTVLPLRERREDFSSDAIGER